MPAPLVRDYSSRIQSPGNREKAVLRGPLRRDPEGKGGRDGGEQDGGEQAAWEIAQ